MVLTKDYYINIAKLCDAFNDINLNDLSLMIERIKKPSEQEKCCLLVRVSTAHQDLVQQTNAVREEALKDGFLDKNIIVIEDKESAVKLSEEERNGLNKLKWYIEHDNVKCVYTYEVSRISRRPSILYSIRDYLISHNVQLIIINPYMKMLKEDGTLSETANIFFGIFSSMAENEGHIRKARMKRGIEHKRALGLHAGGPVSIGYKTDKTGKYIIDEKNAKWVRRIFNDYASGKSVRQLARELQAEGWRPQTTFLTLCQSILNILHRDIYCNDKRYPPLISKETFEKCKQLCKRKTTYHKKGPEALLKGIIRDMKTGYLMSGNMCNKSRQYYCKRYGNTTISMKAADMLIGGLATEWYNVISKVKIDEIRQSINAEIKRQEAIIKQQNDNITENQDKIDRIEERYIDGKISKDRADVLERNVFEKMQYYKKTLQEAQDKIISLNEQLENGKLEIYSLRDKVKYVVDSLYVRRLSRFICEIVVTNKWTGETRTYEYNTRTCTILKMSIKTRPTLNYYG